MKKIFAISCILIAFSLLGFAQGEGGKDDPAPEKGYAARSTGGPDAFGYVFTDSTEGGGPTYSWVDISGTGTSLYLADDEISSAVALGFTFPFYGQDKTDVYIVSNGHLTFDVASGTDLSNDCSLPSSTNGNNDLIGVMWDDMDPADLNSPVYYQYFPAGSAPWGGYSGACFVVSFIDFHHYCSSGGASCPSAGTWQAILFDDGGILIQFQNVGDETGSGSTTGIENSDASIGLTYACDTADSLTDQLAVMFYIPEAEGDADVSVTKTNDVVGEADPGDTVIYTVNITNNGPETATDVAVSDVLPSEVTYVSDTCGGTYDAGSHTITWNIAEMDNTETVQCTITVSVNTGTGGSTPVNNISVTCADDANSDNDNASSQFTVALPPEADLAITKTNNVAGSVYPGDNVVYTVNVTNNGPGAATNVQVVDTLPSGVTYVSDTCGGTYSAAAHTLSWSPGDLANGANGQCTITVTINDDAGDTSPNNSVTVSSDIEDPDNTNNTATSQFAVSEFADLSIIKTVVEEGHLYPGDQLTYAIEVTNNGPGDATNVLVSDMLPAGLDYVSDTCGGVYNAATHTVSWTYATLANGATQTCTITTLITEAAAGSNIINDIEVSADQADPVMDNNLAAASVIVRIPVPTMSTWALIGFITLLLSLTILIRRKSH